MEHAVIDLCRGQYLDLHFLETLPSLADYREMVRLKTGVVIGAACQVGGLGGGNTAHRKTFGCDQVKPVGEAYYRDALIGTAARRCEAEQP